MCLHDENLLFAKMKYVISLHDYLLVIFLLIKIFFASVKEKEDETSLSIQTPFFKSCTQRQERHERSKSGLKHSPNLFKKE